MSALSSSTTLALELFVACWMYIHSMARTTPSYPDLLLAFIPSALVMVRLSPALAARPSTRDAVVAGGDVLIIILLRMFSNTAQLAMLPVTPVALLLMATPASAEQEFDSTRGLPGAPTASTT